jgi:tetratricopeptide (TPR) repeat protein
MNLIFRAIAVLALAGFCAAQTAAPTGSEKTQNKPGQTGQAPAAPNLPSTSSSPEKGQAPSTPGAANSNQGSPTTAQQTPAEPPKPARRTPPAAKSQEEFAEYQKASAITDNAAAAKAADEFAAKFPQSELRPLLYSNLMRHYQQANDSDKTLEMAQKVLQYIPDDTMALVMSATVLAERTRDTDLDRDQRYAEAKRNAQKAIDTVDVGLMVPPNFTQEQFEGAKRVLLSWAHSAIGMVELGEKNDAVAEQHFKQALQLSGEPDALIYMRLSLAQDHQKKYAEALVSARAAVQNAPANSPLQGLAQQEVDRLVKLPGSAPPATGGGTGAAATQGSVPK